MGVEPQKIKIRDMQRKDVARVIEIRNHPLTYNFLHTPRTFSIEEAYEWYDTVNPRWYVIELHNLIVGYIRTSNYDFLSRSIWVGCDICHKHRRNGYAYAAYKLFFSIIKKLHWKTVKLSVLKTNVSAFNLYKKIGFCVYGEDEISYMMSYEIRDDMINTQRGVKVISCYFGNRRATPVNAKETYNMLKFIWEMETRLKDKYQYDTIFVINKLLSTDPRDNDNDVALCEIFLNSINNKETANGRCFVINRPNIGLSFGAFDHAFHMFKNNYDYWFFTEDDQIVVRENFFHDSLYELHQIKNNVGVGFVASVAINPHVNAACGGCGVTSREVLDEITKRNFSEVLNRGALPFHYVDIKSLEFGRPQTANNHELSAEVPFTQVIHNLGLLLINFPSIDIGISWGAYGRRCILVRPFEKWMEKEYDINKYKFESGIIGISYDYLQGKFKQSNGDEFEVIDDECIFNGKMIGNCQFKFNKMCEITWGDYVWYYVFKDSSGKIIAASTHGVFIELFKS